MTLGPSAVQPLIVALATPWCAAALAQAPPQPEGPVSLTPGSPLKTVDLRPRLVHQGVVDRGGLAESLYDADARLELRHDRDWQRIYETQGRDGQRRFVRYNGAISASFPASQYVWSRETKSEVPVTPGGTVYHIGQPGPWSVSADWPFPAPNSATQSVSSLRINGRADAQPALELTPHVERPAEPRTIADEAYRARRIGELMRLAAAREAERSARR